MSIWGINAQVVFVIALLSLLDACRSTVEKRAETGASSGTKPSAVSYTPAVGSGLHQDFTLVVSDPKGYQAIDVVLGLVSETVVYTNNCQFLYERARNIVTLYSDEKGWLKPITLGNEGVLDNGLCVIDAKGATAIGSADTLTLKVPITFNPKFSGQKALYLLAQEGPYGGQTSTSGWQVRGTWAVPGR